MLGSRDFLGRSRGYMSDRRRASRPPLSQQPLPTGSYEPNTRAGESEEAERARLRRERDARRERREQERERLLAEEQAKKDLRRTHSRESHVRTIAAPAGADKFDIATPDDREPVLEEPAEATLETSSGSASIPAIMAKGATRAAIATGSFGIAVGMAVGKGIGRAALRAVSAPPDKRSVNQADPWLDLDENLKQVVDDVRSKIKNESTVEVQQRLSQDALLRALSFVQGAQPVTSNAGPTMGDDILTEWVKAQCADKDVDTIIRWLENEAMLHEILRRYSAGGHLRDMDGFQTVSRSHGPTTAPKAKATASKAKEIISKANELSARSSRTFLKAFFEVWTNLSLEKTRAARAVANALLSNMQKKSLAIHFVEWADMSFEKVDKAIVKYNKHISKIRAKCYTVWMHHHNEIMYMRNVPIRRLRRESFTAWKRLYTVNKNHKNFQAKAKFHRLWKDVVMRRKKMENRMDELANALAYAHVQLRVKFFRTWKSQIARTSRMLTCLKTFEEEKESGRARRCFYAWKKHCRFVAYTEGEKLCRMFLRWRGELIFYAWVDLCDNQTALKSEPDELASVVVKEPAVAEKTETDEATPLTQDALKAFLRQYEAKQNEVNAGIMAELKAMKEWREQVDARSSAGSRSSARSLRSIGKVDEREVCEGSSFMPSEPESGNGSSSSDSPEPPSEPDEASDDVDVGALEAAARAKMAGVTSTKVKFLDGKTVELTEIRNAHGIATCVYAPSYADVYPLSKNLFDVSVPKRKANETVTLNCNFEDLSNKSIKEGCKTVTKYDSENYDQISGYAPNKQTSLKWYQHVKSVVYYHLAVRRAIRNKTARSLYRIAAKDLLLPNAALRDIEAGPLGAAVRKSLASHPKDSKLRLWKAERQSVILDPNASIVGDTTIELLYFQLMPLFRSGVDKEIGELIQESSWCNPPPKISGVYDRLKLWRDDIRYRRDLWPAEPHPPILDMRRVLMNFRLILKDSDDSTCETIYRQLMDQEQTISLDDCQDSEILLSHLDWLIEMFAALQHHDEACHITEAMKKTRDHNLLTLEKSLPKAPKGKGKGDHGRAAAAKDDDYQAKQTLNASLSKIACPAFGGEKECGLCVLSDFCILSHKAGRSLKCVCGQWLMNCDPKKHRKVTRQDGKKFVKYVDGNEVQKEFLYGGLNEKPPPLTDAQKELAKKRDDLLISKKAFHALPRSHRKSTKFEDWKKKRDKAGSAMRASDGADAKNEEAPKFTKKNKVKKARYLNDYKAFISGKADAETIARVKAALDKADASTKLWPDAPQPVPKAEPVPKAVPTQAGLPPGMRMLREAGDIVGTMKMSTSKNHELMLSDSGCFRFAGPRGCTQDAPNSTARVQPIDGPAVTIDARREANGESLLFLGNELVGSENRLVERKLKRGTHFDVVRQADQTRYIELDDRGRDAVNEAYKKECARIQGRMITLDRKRGCDYVEGADVAQIWEEMGLPALKQCVESVDPRAADADESTALRDELKIKAENVREHMIEYQRVLSDFSVKAARGQSLPLTETWKHWHFQQACECMDTIYRTHKTTFDAMTERMIGNNESRRPKRTDVSVDTQGNGNLSEAGNGSACWALSSNYATLPFAILIMLAAVVRGASCDAPTVQRIRELNQTNDGGKRCECVAGCIVEKSVQTSDIGQRQLSARNRNRAKGKVKLSQRVENASEANRGTCCCCGKTSSHVYLKCELPLCQHVLCTGCWANQGGVCPKTHHAANTSMTCGRPLGLECLEEHTENVVTTPTGEIVYNHDHHGLPRHAGSIRHAHQCCSCSRTFRHKHVITEPQLSREIYGRGDGGEGHFCKECEQEFQEKAKSDQLTSGAERICGLCLSDFGPRSAAACYPETNICGRCEHERLPGIVGHLAVVEGAMAAAVGDIEEDEQRVWTRRWRNKALSPTVSNISWRALGIRDDDFTFCYCSEIDHDRLVNLLAYSRPFQLEVRAAWRSAKKAFPSSLYDTVKTFESILGFVAPGDDTACEYAHGMKVGTAGTQTRRRPKRTRVTTFDSCLLHVGYDHRCEQCRMVMQKLLGKHRGTTALSRGFWIGYVVLYGDLKTSMPRSLRGNTIFFVITAYLEAQWDSDKSYWRYSQFIRIGVPLRKKNERNILYGLRVALTEFRIGPHDKWYIHFDNEPAMLGAAVLAAISVMGGDLVNCLPNLHDSTAEANINVAVRDGSVALRKSNLGPLVWDCVYETIMYWAAEDKVKLSVQNADGTETQAAWSRFYNKVPRFQPGALIACPLPVGAAGRQTTPVGAQWATPLGIARRTGDGVYIQYRDANAPETFHLTVVSFDSCEFREPVELAFPPGKSPVALKEPWPDADRTSANHAAYTPYFVPCQDCGIWRSVRKETYDAWSAGTIDSICHAFAKNQILPERWSCYEPAEDFEDEALDWQQPTGDHQACQRIVLDPEPDVILSHTDVLQVPATDDDARGDQNDLYDDADTSTPVAAPRADEIVDEPRAIDIPIDIVDEAMPSSANPFDGYSPHHVTVETWTAGDYAKLADLKARKFLNAASDLLPWWRKMKIKDFTEIYNATEAKKMCSCILDPRADHRLKVEVDLLSVQRGSLCTVCLDEDASDSLDSGRVHEPTCGRHHGGPTIPVQHIYTCPSCYRKADQQLVDQCFDYETRQTDSQDRWADRSEWEAHSAKAAQPGASGAPKYVPFDLTCFDAVPADDSPTVHDDSETASDGDLDLDNVLDAIQAELQNFDGMDDVQRGYVETMMQSMPVKGMTKSQKHRWKRQNRKLLRNVAKFRQNIGERDRLIGPDASTRAQQRVVFEIEDLQGSLRRIDEIIATLGYLPPQGRCTEEEAALLEANNVKVTKTVTLSDLKGREPEVQEARDREAAVIRDFGVLGEPVADTPEIRSLPGFNFAPIIGAYALKWFGTPDETIRARAVYNGAISKLGDNAKAIYELIKDIPASLLEIRLVIIITRLKGWLLRQADVVGAYLNSPAPKNSFVKLPREWACLLGESARRKFLDMLDAGIPCLVELRKALYGHVLAGVLWSRWFASKLTAMGWVQIKDCSTSLWLLYDQSKELVGILSIYVDDFIIGAGKEILKWFEATITKVVALKIEGNHTTGLHPIDKLVGGHYISRITEEADGQHEEVFIDAGAYAGLIADRFFQSDACHNTEYAKPGRFMTPMDTASFTAPDGVNASGIFQHEVSTHTGAGLWCQRIGMANLCAATCALAREAHNWTTLCDKALHRYMSYLKNIGSKLGLLLYIVAMKGEEVIVLGQSDADHGGNARTRISISGFHVYIVTLRGTFCLVEWTSSRQRAIALSTAEAELAALQLLLKAVLNVCTVLRLCGIFPRVILCVDSVSAIAVAQSGISSKLRYSSVTQGLSAAWIQEVCSLLSSEPTKIDTVLNSCDVQTKGLPLGPFRLHSLFMGMMEKTIWERTVRCQGRHLSPLGEIRCKARCENVEPFLCGSCASGSQLCPCWYGVTSFDARYRQVHGITV